MSSNSRIKSYFAPFQRNSWPDSKIARSEVGSNFAQNSSKHPIIAVSSHILAHLNQQGGKNGVRANWPHPTAPLCEIFICLEGWPMKLKKKFNFFSRQNHIVPHEGGGECHDYLHIPDTQCIVNILPYTTFLFRSRNLYDKKLLQECIFTHF